MRKKSKKTQTPDRVSVTRRELTGLDDLKAAPYNPRVQSEEGAAGLRYSIEEYGDLSGITWNARTGNLVAGHQRVKQLRGLGGRFHVDPPSIKVERQAEISDPHSEEGAADCFPVRVVDWPIEKEKAANVIANNRHVAGEFTRDLAPLLDEVKITLRPEAFETMQVGKLLKDMREPSQRPASNVSPQIEKFADDDRKLVRIMAGYKTSINRAKKSAPVEFFERSGLLSGDVLDYGAGMDKHTYAAFDPETQPNYELLRRRYPVVMCNYVLNVIPLTHNRFELVRTILSLVEPGGTALLSAWISNSEERQSKSGYQCDWNAPDWREFLNTIDEFDQLGNTGSVFAAFAYHAPKE